MKHRLLNKRDGLSNITERLPANTGPSPASDLKNLHRNDDCAHHFGLTTGFTARTAAIESANPQVTENRIRVIEPAGGRKVHTIAILMQFFCRKRNREDFSMPAEPSGMGLAG